MKKNGFISTTLIYTFFVIFLLLMLLLLNSYTRIRYLLDEYKYEIKNEFIHQDAEDIEIHFRKCDSSGNNCELTSSIPRIGYEYIKGTCDNGSDIKYADGLVNVFADKRDICYADFKKIESDITIKICLKDDESSECTYVPEIPYIAVYNYIQQGIYTAISNLKKPEYSYCNSDIGSISFENEKLVVNSNEKTECTAVFVKRKNDINIFIYKQDENGKHEYGGKKYSLSSRI